MRAILALEDGLVLTGKSFTGPGETGGEVIFNTGMTGYQEVLTDPSYAGQMVVMTYPLIGNYGINPEDMESDRVYLEAFLVKECCKTPSNWRAKESLPDYLRRHSILGVEGIDTRALTRHLRIHGAKRGVVSTMESDPAVLVEKAKHLPEMVGQGLGSMVTTKVPYAWVNGAPKPLDLTKDNPWPAEGKRVVVYDFGVKWNILRLLEEQGFAVLVVPAGTSAATVKELAPDGVFLSNGPGDPAALTEIIQEISQLAESYPTAGICLGHQLLGHALGGSTYKLKFGHHGCNHPVQELATGKIEISSQNHGFCVDLSGVSGIKATHVNLNDETLEGFAHETKPIIAIQYHPEASPGPHDSRNFFNRFRRLVDEAAA